MLTINENKFHIVNSEKKRYFWKEFHRKIRHINRKIIIQMESSENASK